MPGAHDIKSGGKSILPPSMKRNETPFLSKNRDHFCYRKRTRDGDETRGEWIFGMV